MLTVDEIKTIRENPELYRAIVQANLEAATRAVARAMATKPVDIVETRMGNTWENCWTEDDKPLTFPTRAHAQEGIADLLAEMPDYSPEDYRITEVAA